MFSASTLGSEMMIQRCLSLSERRKVVPASMPPYLPSKLSMWFFISDPKVDAENILIVNP